MNSPDTNFREWMLVADEDFLNIENNLAAPLVPWRTVCYHAHQAAEKMLKAFLVYHLRPYPRNHDLLAMLAQGVELDERLGELEEDCRSLEGYATDTRYPPLTFNPDEETGINALAAARRVQAQITLILASDASNR